MVDSVCIAVRISPSSDIEINEPAVLRQCGNEPRNAQTMKEC